MTNAMIRVIASAKKNTSAFILELFPSLTDATKTITFL
jgi:hypothetical protein